MASLTEVVGLAHDLAAVQGNVGAVRPIFARLVVALRGFPANPTFDTDALAADLAGLITMAKTIEIFPNDDFAAKTRAFVDHANEKVTAFVLADTPAIRCAGVISGGIVEGWRTLRTVLLHPSLLHTCGAASPHVL